MSDDLLKLAECHHNDLSRFAPEMQAEIIRWCEETTARHRAPDWEPCVRSGHACHRCQDAALRARSAA